MSYTPPAGNAVNFSWQGEAAYTPPAATAVDFDFSPSGALPASGFSETAFGVPIGVLGPAPQVGNASGFTSTAIGMPAAAVQFAGVASGFTSTVLGDPVRGGIQIESASGFASTAIGAPSVALTQSASGFQTGSPGEHASLVSFGAAGIAPTTTVSTPLALFSMVPTGFSSTTFGGATASTTFNGQAGSIDPLTQLGEPTVAAICTASPIEPTTQVPRAYFAFNQWLFGSGAAPSTIFGLGYGINVPALPLEHQTVAASGFSPTVFGQAQAKTTAQGTATGLVQTGYGTPSVRVSYGADGFTTGSVGNPLSVMLGRASGFRSTVIPAPYGAPARAAAPISPKTRFGTPKAIRPNVYSAYSFGATRLGQPSGAQFFGHQVDGWVATVLGTPLGYSTLKARPSGPGTRVGRPTLRRNPTC